MKLDSEKTEFELEKAAESNPGLWVEHFSCIAMA